MWQGLDLDERPDQGPSPIPFLTLRELLQFSGEKVPAIYLGEA